MDQTDSSRLKQKRIEKMITDAAAADVKIVQSTPSLPSHYAEQGGGDYQAPAIRTAPASWDVSSGIGPGGQHYNIGGLATMFQRRR